MTKSRTGKAGQTASGSSVSEDVAANCLRLPSAHLRKQTCRALRPGRWPSLPGRWSPSASPPCRRSRWPPRWWCWCTTRRVWASASEGSGCCVCAATSHPFCTDQWDGALDWRVFLACNSFYMRINMYFTEDNDLAIYKPMRHRKSQTCSIARHSSKQAERICLSHSVSWKGGTHLAPPSRAKSTSSRQETCAAGKTKYQCEVAMLLVSQTKPGPALEPGSTALHASSGSWEAFKGAKIVLGTI